VHCWVVAICGSRVLSSHDHSFALRWWTTSYFERPCEHDQFSKYVATVRCREDGNWALLSYDPSTDTTSIVTKATDYSRYAPSGRFLMHAYSFFWIGDVLLLDVVEGMHFGTLPMAPVHPVLLPCPCFVPLHVPCSSVPPDDKCRNLVRVDEAEDGKTKMVRRAA